MAVRSMRFEAAKAPDYSTELKKVLDEGLTAFRAMGRTISAEEANEVIRVVEQILLDVDGAGRRARGPKVIRRSRFAKWTKQDFEALAEANWDVLDPLWEKVVAGDVVADIELTQAQQLAIKRAYKKVPQDARTERWPESQLISKLRYLVKAFKHAEQR